MTQTFDDLVQPENPSTEVKRYPSEWYEFYEDGIEKPVHYRYLDEFRFEIRSATHYLTVNQEGLNLFKLQDQSLQGHVIFKDWCERNSVTPTPRKDIENGMAPE